ncbi:hypothetical protein NL676_008361 [Syzygium grande]|nr:hypothetical protein NL676_008361 [Syzygium grande]
MSNGSLPETYAPPFDRPAICTARLSKEVSGLTHLLRQCPSRPDPAKPAASVPLANQVAFNGVTGEENVPEPPIRVMSISGDIHKYSVYNLQCCGLIGRRTANGDGCSVTANGSGLAKVRVG